MKKILFIFTTLCCIAHTDAQTMKIYKGSKLVAAYAADKADKVVFEGTTIVSSITLDKTAINVLKGKNSTLVASVMPDYAGDRTVSWSSSNNSIATVADGVVTAVNVGIVNIIATANDGSGVSAICSVKVIAEPEYVDLGLSSGTLWASCNLGANSPEESGDFFAWGETSPKSSFNINNYKYYFTIQEKDGEFTNTYSGYTKYVCQNSSSLGLKGFQDNKNKLELEDDAAYINLGDNWRMPTGDELEELCYNCTWQWCTYKNVNGYKVTGPNGAYIFLPACYGYGKNEGEYWSSSIYSVDANINSPSDEVRRLFFRSDYHYMHYNPNIGYALKRYEGMSIRPVYVFSSYE